MNLPLILTVMMIVANGLIPQMMNKSIKDGSRSLRTLVSPASYTFSIWSFIYIGLVLMFLSSSEFQSVHYYFVSCVLNCAWIFFWLNEHLVTSSIILVGMIGSLFMFWSANAGAPIVYQNIIATYLAWLTGAVALNGGFVLRETMALKDETTSRLIIAFVCVVQVAWQWAYCGSGRAALSQGSLAVPLVGVWTAVGMLNNGKPSNLPWAFLAVSVVCGISSVLCSIN